MNVQKRNLITDEIELREYDSLLAICLEVNDAKVPSLSHRHSVRNSICVRRYVFDRLSKCAAPPPGLLVDEAICGWATIREKCRRAAEAYDEMLNEFGR